MDIRQIQALLAVQDWGSFSAAADALDTVQSNISAHVSKLEKELLVTLVDRRAGKLTEEGEIVAERGRRIIGEIDSLQSDVAALHSEVRGTVHLGALSTTVRWLVPVLYNTIRRHHPHIELIVTEATSSSLESRLQDSAIDVAISNMPFQIGVDSRPLFEEDLLLVVPEHHPFRDRKSIDLTELASEKLLLPPPHTVFRQELDSAAKKKKMQLLPLIELDGVRMITTLALDGFAPAIVPATALPARLRSGFQKISVVGLPRRRVGVALRKSARPAAPTRALLELLDDVVADGLKQTEGTYITEAKLDSVGLARRDELNTY